MVGRFRFKPIRDPKLSTGHRPQSIQAVAMATAGVALSMLSSAHLCRGATDNWLPAAGGSFDFNTASNWSLNQTPGASDTANLQLDLAGDQAVNVAA